MVLPPANAVTEKRNVTTNRALRMMSSLSVTVLLKYHSSHVGYGASLFKVSSLATWNLQSGKPERSMRSGCERQERTGMPLRRTRAASHDEKLLAVGAVLLLFYTAFDDGLDTAILQRVKAALAEVVHFQRLELAAAIEQRLFFLLGTRLQLRERHLLKVRELGVDLGHVFFKRRASLRTQ